MSAPSTFELLTDLLIEQEVDGKTVRAILATWMDRKGVPARSINRYGNWPEILAVFAERGVRLPDLEGEADTAFSEAAFGVTVREQRELRKWTQDRLRKELMAAYGIAFTRTQMSRFEMGQRPIRLSEALALSHLLGIDLPRFASPRPAGDAR